MLNGLNHANWRTRPIRTGMRIAASLVRRKLPGLKLANVHLRSQGIRVIADLGTANGLGIYRYGWHDLSVELVATLLGPGDVFIDGGANRGMYTLAAAKRVGPTGRVYAFEPSHDTFIALAANIRANSFSWATPIPAALGRAPGFVNFTAFHGDGCGLSSIAPSLVGGDRMLVPLTTLDTLLETLGTRPVRLVKLDVEGAEHEALRGAGRILEQRPHLWLEVVPNMLERMGSSATALINDLRDLGYVFFRRTGRLQLKRDVNPVHFLPEPNVFATARVDELSDAGIQIVE